MDFFQKKMECSLDSTSHAHWSAKVKRIKKIIAHLPGLVGMKKLSWLKTMAGMTSLRTGRTNEREWLMKMSEDTPEKVTAEILLKRNVFLHDFR